MATASVATSLEASVEVRLSNLREHAQQWKSQPFTIFRVPAYVRESNRYAYEPRMVSVGPYYHGSPSLRAMEDHKWRDLQDLLSRNATLTSATLINEMRSLEARARACYSEQPLLGSDDFVRMLLLDSCFILEFFFKWHTKVPDALCDVGWSFTVVKTDLLLLENQIPFFVVERLYGAVAGAQGGRESLLKLLVKCLSKDVPIARPSATTCEIHHLLHLYYESFVTKLPLPSSPPPGTSQKNTVAPPCMSVVDIVRRKKPKAALGIPRATEMSVAGITFVRREMKEEETRTHAKSLAGDVYNVKFDWRRGVMEIPGLVVDDMTKRPLLVNLVAFEQTRGAGDTGLVTSYVSLMSMLIRGKDDVEMLRRLDILDNLLADDDEAARFFSHLGDGFAMNYDRQVFAGLYKDVQRYCDSWRHRNRALLMRNYFGNPWSAIAVIASALLLALTATQAYFTVFPPKK